MNIPFSPALMSINDFSTWSRLGRTRIYEEIGSGKLPILKIGRRTFIRTADAEAWLANYTPAHLSQSGGGQ